MKMTMKYFHYTADLQDGERIERIDLCIGISAEHMFRFGFVWMVERIVLALRKRVKFDHIIDYHVSTIPADKVADHSDRPWIISDSWRNV